MPEEKEGWRTKSRQITLDHEIKQFSKAFRENFFTLIISSFGLLTALTWNNFWTSWISSLSAENTMPYKFLVALGVTLMAVVMTYLFSRIKGKEK